MDHVIDFILDYMAWEKEEFINEWKSREYKKISDCPTYPYVKCHYSIK